jgi:hypothetical protein
LLLLQGGFGALERIRQFTVFIDGGPTPCQDQTVRSSGDAPLTWTNPLYLLEVLGVNIEEALEVNAEFTVDGHVLVVGILATCEDHRYAHRMVRLSHRALSRCESGCNSV